jgi:hypothetical protein
MPTIFFNIHVESREYVLTSQLRYETNFMIQKQSLFTHVISYLTSEAISSIISPQDLVVKSLFRNTTTCKIMQVQKMGILPQGSLNVETPCFRMGPVMFDSQQHNESRNMGNVN